MSKIDRTMARHLAKKQSPRLNLRLSKELLLWAKEYAKRTNTTVTQLIADHLRELRAKDNEVPQI